MFRLIINDAMDRHFVMPTGRGRGGWITTQAAEILSASVISSDNPKESTFILHANELQWIKNDRFNGTIRRINTAHHLKRIQVELTTRCNLKCAYCYSESGPANDKSLDAASILALLADADEMGVVTVDFTGGEVLLHKNWEQIIGFAKSRGFVISVHTNGTALNERNVQMLRAMNVNYLQVAIDSHKPDVHDFVRGSAGALEKSLSGIERAVSSGIRTKITLMIHSANVHELPQSINYLKERFGNHVDLALDRLMPTGGELSARLAISPKDYYEAVTPLTRRSVVTSKKCESQAGEQDFEPHCGVGQSFAYITSDGEIAACPTMTSRDNEIFRGANLRDMTLQDAWLYHPTFTKYRFVNCQNVKHCPAGTICRGGCRSNAYFETGDITSPDVVSCNTHKNPNVNFIDFHEEYRRQKINSISSVV